MSAIIIWIGQDSLSKATVLASTNVLEQTTRENHEKIPLGGPSRTEAEHPQPRFGVVEQLFHLPMSDDGDFNRGEARSHD